MQSEPSSAEDKSRLTLIIVVAVIAFIVIGGFFYLLLRKSVAQGPPPTLQGAIRRGSPDWDKYSKLIALDEPEADEANRALGDIVMTLRTTVRQRSRSTSSRARHRRDARRAESRPRPTQEAASASRPFWVILTAG